MRRLPAIADDPGCHSERTLPFAEEDVFDEVIGRRLVAGAFVLRGAVWARVAGIAVAALSAVLNFMWLPYYPVWSILIIAVDVLVIWALTAHGRDITR